MEEAMRSLQRKAKLMMAKEVPAEEIKQKVAELGKLKEFEELEAKELGKKSEMLFMMQVHMCNVRIKQGI